MKNDRWLRSIPGRGKNLESSTLLWFDPSMQMFEDGEKTQEDLRAINDHVLFHTDIAQCVLEMEKIDKEMIFLITSGSQAVSPPSTGG